MSAVVSAISDVVGDVVEAVGDVVEDVGDFIIDDIVKPVGKAVENTVEQALNDPIGTALKVAAVASGNPQLLPLISGANALANGADLDQALLSAGTSYVASGITSGMDFDMPFDSEILDASARGATTGALSSVLRGQDPLQGAVSGALNTGLNKALDVGASSLSQAMDQPEDKSILNYQVPRSVLGEFADMDDEFALRSSDQIQADLDNIGRTDYSIASAKPMGDITPGGLGIDPNAFGLGLTMDSITGRAPSLTSMGGGQGLVTDVNAPLGDPSSFINSPEYASDRQGVVSAAGFTDASALPVLGDPSSFINNPDVTGKPIIPVPSCAYNVNAPNIRLGSASPAQRQRALGLAFGAGDMSIPWLDTRAQMLAGQAPTEAPTGSVGGLGGAVPSVKLPAAPIQQSAVPSMLQTLTPELRGLLADRGYDTGFATGGGVQNFADGSSASFCQSYGLASQYTPKFYSVKCNMLTSPSGKRSPLGLAQLKQLQPHISASGNIGGLARGGLPAKYQEAAPEGHNPEFITGVTGYYAGGRGTGQSDDIPAMLHDGDYVMDAEAVSAFGDGSSKAGNEVLMRFMHQVPHAKRVGTGKPVPAKIADGEVVFPESFVTALGGGDNKRGARMLDEMRHRLREHKRSAPNSKIPPKAKSPLDYLKGVKG